MSSKCGSLQRNVDLWKCERLDLSAMRSVIACFTKASSAVTVDMHQSGSSGMRYFMAENVYIDLITAIII